LYHSDPRHHESPEPPPNQSNQCNHEDPG
jgi:hypothetical protein